MERHFSGKSFRKLWTTSRGSPLFPFGTEFAIYVRYIAEVLKTRSNLAAKSKVQLLPLALTVSFKFPRGGCVMACRMQV